MNELREYVDLRGLCPFEKWLAALDLMAKVRVVIAISRMEAGNFSNVKGVGHGVLEYKIHFGPGYRIYFGKDGDKVVVLLAGGTKKRQQSDIAEAQLAWADYKQRKISKPYYGTH